MSLRDHDRFGRPYKPASKRLLSRLHEIARSLMDAQRTEGKVVKKETSDGYDVTFIPKRGPGGVRLTHVDPKYLQELGQLLMWISEGEDAYRLFRQNERTKRKMDQDHAIGALAYWAQFAADPHSKRNRDAAVGASRAILPSLAQLSDVTIRDIAKNHRARALDMLSFPVIYEIRKGHVIKAPSRQQHTALLAYLRKKGAHSD